MLLLPLVGVAEQDHLTQEGVHDHVLVVDLFAARREEGRHPKERGGKGGGEKQEERGEKRQKAISSHRRENYKGKESVTAKRGRMKHEKSDDVQEFLRNAMSSSNIKIKLYI